MKMAKVILGALISDIRNKVGGAVFTKSRYGNIVRRRLKPTNPRTNLQTTVRGTFTTNATGWDSLTGAEQAAWIAWAAANSFTDRFGGAKNLSANAAYVRYQQLRATVGLAPTTATPSALAAYPTVPTAAAAVGATGHVTLTTPAQSATSGWYVVRTTAGLKTGVTFAGSKLRIAGVVAAAAAATTAVVTPATYNPKLAFATGQKVIVKYALIDVNGLIAAVGEYSVIAT
jgi:hypothetical protein